MTIAPGSQLLSRSFASSPAAREGKVRPRNYRVKCLSLVAAAMLLAPLVFTQSVTGVDPSSGKADDTVTVSGKMLEKDSVSAVYLSDDKTDYKTTVVSQAGDKIVIKVPHVKPGVYNVSILAGKQIMILPVHFTVQE
jgi:hypothetical protein